ncbi:MAG: hypothetical protein B6D58_04130 [candidate division Zixibacteria bacterium 4484_95]|nr:MAG: hypothetical protein B6D58_04130 [candidate division Zixibacteria bacterium 4484_95]
MEKNLVRVASHILDLEEPKTDLQEALFSVSGRDILKLDNNEATIGPSPLVTRALSRYLSDRTLNQQPDMSARKLRRKISLYSGVNYDSIACFANMAETMEAVARTYLDHNLEVVISWPSDDLFGHYAASAGAKIIKAEYSDPFTPAVELIISRINSKTRVVYISNPGNPTGTSLTEAEIVFLLSYAEDVLVLVDESYFEFCGITMADLIPKFPNLAVIRTFSKAFALAGLDVSYILTDSRNLKFINRLGYLKAPGTLAQVAADAALDDINYTAGYVRQVNMSKKILFDNLPRMGYEFRITAGNFFLLKVNDADKLVETMSKSNIFINNLSRFSGFENYVQVTIGIPSHTHTVLNLLGRLAGEQASRLGRFKSKEKFVGRSVKSKESPKRIRFKNLEKPVVG